VNNAAAKDDFIPVQHGALPGGYRILGQQQLELEPV
jgi:hypothetical protein